MKQEAVIIDPLSELHRYPYVKDLYLTSRQTFSEPELKQLLLDKPRPIARLNNPYHLTAAQLIHQTHFYHTQYRPQDQCVYNRVITVVVDHSLFDDNTAIEQLLELEKLGVVVFIHLVFDHAAICQNLVGRLQNCLLQNMPIFHLSVDYQFSVESDNDPQQHFLSEFCSNLTKNNRLLSLRFRGNFNEQLLEAVATHDHLETFIPYVEPIVLNSSDQKLAAMLRLLLSNRTIKRLTLEPMLGQSGHNNHLVELIINMLNAKPELDSLLLGNLTRQQVKRIADEAQIHPGLTFLGLNHSNIAPLRNIDQSNEGAESLSSMLAHNHRLRTLQLRNTHLGFDIKTIVRGLKANKGLYELDLSDSFLNHQTIKNHDFDIELADTLKTVLANHCTLRRLSIDGIEGEGMQSLAEGLSNGCRLTYLKNTHRLNTREEFAGLAQILTNNTTLAELVIYGSSTNKSSKNLQKAFASNQGLRQLTWHNLNNNDLFHMAKGLFYQNSLRVLSLGYANLKTKGAQIIAELLQNNNCLQSLRLYECGLGDQSAIIIANGLQQSFLEHLYIAGSFSDQVYQKLNEAYVNLNQRHGFKLEAM